MAKEVDTGMDKGEMKKLLMKSKKEPVNFSFGMGSDASFALLMLDRIKAPKAVEKELEKKFSDAKNTRFGSAEVDTEEDAKKVKFIVNKPISGFGRKLVKTLKGTGFTKVQILLEDGTSVEDYSEEEESETQEAQSDDRTQAQIDAGVPPPPPPPPPQQQAPQLNADQLMQLLTAQVRLIPDVVKITPALKDMLTKLAASGQVNIKTNNLTYAKVAIDQLTRAIADAPKQPPQQQQQQQQGTTPEGAKGTYTKSGQAWLATRKKIEEDIEKLRAEIVATYEAQGIGAKLDAAYRARVQPVLDALDTSLADTLAAATKAADPKEQTTLVADAKAILQRYQQFVASDATIGDLDANPFVPLQLAKFVGGTLDTLSKAVH
jgi:hypothetical protein